MRTPASLPPPVAAALASVGRRRRVLALAEAACLALPGLAALVLLAPLAALLPSVPSWVCWLARAWAVASMLAPFALLAVPPFRRTTLPLLVARTIDDHLPATRDSLLVAVDLAASIDAGSIEDPVTRRLALDHMDEAAARAGDVDPAALLPVSSLGRRALAGPVAAALALCMVAILPGPVERGLAALLFGDAGPPAGEDAGFGQDAATLVLRNLEVTLEPPAYTGREPLVLEGTSGDFRALPGTRATLAADLPGSGGTATIAWEGTPPMAWPAEVDGGELSASFVVPGGGGYRIVLDRGRLREPQRSRLFRVEELPDHPPDLDVDAPDGETELGPDDEIALAVLARDDFALGRLALVVQQRGRRVSEAEVAQVQGLPAFEGVARWSPNGEQAGGELELVVEAWDNDTVGGPKVTRSRPVRVWVPTPRDHHARVLAGKRRLLDQALDLLAELLVADAAGRQTLDRNLLVAAFEHQDRLAGGLLVAARELAAAMEQDRFERRQVHHGIGQIAENLAILWEEVRELVEGSIRHAPGARVPASALADLVRARQEVVVELERIVLELADFVDLHATEQIEARLADLDSEMADLADLLRQARDGKQVGGALAAALDELARELAELGRELADRPRGPDDGHVNRMPADLGPDLLAELAEMIAQGRQDEALGRLQRAMESLARMREQIRGEAEDLSGGQAMAARDAALERALEQARDLERRQQEIIDATRRLQERLGTGEAVGESERDALLRDMAELREMIGEIPPATLDPETRGALRQWARLAARSAEGAESAFATGTLEDAARSAEETTSYLEAAAAEVADAAVAAGTAGLDEARAGVRRAGTLAADIAARLAEAESRSRRAAREAIGAADPLRDRQRGVREGTRDLRESLDQVGGSATNPVAARQGLERAGQLMEGAEGRLAEGRTGPAIASEEGALRQLQAFGDSLEQAMRAMRDQGTMPGGSAMAMGGSDPWRRVDHHDGWEDRGEVVMPDPEDFVTPEAFRALVQEEARGDAPDRYRPLNGSYYEEIVR